MQSSRSSWRVFAPETFPALAPIDTIGSMKLYVLSGMGCGLLGGALLGVMTSSGLGFIACSMVCAAIGSVAGIVMSKEDDRAQARMKELDDEIGITSGSMGVPRGSIPDDLTDEARELRQWAREWLTPPPPAIG